MKKILIASVIITLISWGCSKGYLSDLSNNPNAPTTGVATPQLILPAAITNLVNIVNDVTATGGNPSYDNVAIWMGYWNVQSGYSFNSTVANYVMTSSGPQLWDPYFGILTNLNFMIQTTGDAKNANYRDIANILEAVCFANLVDLYNDIPYTNALKGKGNFFPKYDKASDIYDSLTAKLFKTRLDLMAAFDARQKAGTARDPEPESVLRGELAETLRAEVAAMNIDNFIVRPKRKLVETYAKAEAWAELDDTARQQLAHEVAGLPSEREAEPQEAKQFDLLVLNLQLCVLGQATGFEKLKARAMEIASALEEQSAIPAIRDQLELIAELQTDLWWQDVTVGMLENARKRLRGLVHLIEKRKRKPIYTDFQDEIGEGAEVAFDAFTPPDAFEKFRAKARHFLRQHQDHVAVHKLRTNRQLTPTDLDELERMLRESGTGSEDDIAKAKASADGLGLFVRSLVGLDRAAAKEAFAGFLAGKAMTANQITFINMMIDQLTENGAVDAGRLYESPYTDVNPLGVDGVFSQAAVDEMFAILDDVRRRAAA